MPLRPKKRQEDSSEKTIEINAEMQGTLRFNDPVNLKINGHFNGTLDIKGTLNVGESAVVEANINGDNIVIAGKVTGDITANKMLVMLPTAIQHGNITTPKLNIVEGAIFEGNCQMKEGLLNLDEVSRYLEIDLNEIQDLANSGKIPAIKQGASWKFERNQIDEWAAAGRLK